MLVTHGVDEEIDTQTERFNGRFQRIDALINVIPEIFEIVVVAGDNRESAVLILQSVKDRLAIDEIRRRDVQRIDVEEVIEDRMLDRQPFKVTVRECLVEIPLQRVQVARTIE